MRNITRLFLTGIWLAALAVARAEDANATLEPRQFAHPDRIHYDRQCFTIDGQDVIVYSGAFHYFRCPKELWRDRFQKIKEAGFNCVETYVAWNVCEPSKPAGANDFSKANLKDLDEWLAMAQEFGLYIIVRPGPYICAEWATGGYPRWLLAERPAAPLRGEGWLRTDDPAYLAWCKHWFDEVCPVIAKHQITRVPAGQPGVIMVQVENEYDFAHFPDAVKINQVKALAQYAWADGIDVPLNTCWTHQVRGSKDPTLRQIFDCCNFYPRWNVEDELSREIPKLRREQPDAPLGTTELQGGWFAQVGGKLSQDQEGITAAQINNLTLFAIQEGDTLMNYYMLFGGSNFGDWSARDLPTTYDYNAPIREWGGVGDRYQRVRAIGWMLREHGARLARAEAVDCTVKTAQPDVEVAVKRAADGSRYIFVRTSEHEEPRAGQATVKDKTGEETTFNYDLEPFGSKILYLPAGTTDASKGEWLPKPAPAIVRPTDLPAAITIATAKMRPDPGPAHLKALTAGESLVQAGIYGSPFLYYETTLRNAEATNLMVDFPAGDAVLAEVNGQPIAAAGSTSSTAVFALPAGKNKVDLLYENHGYPNFGDTLEQPGGILGARFVSGAKPQGEPVVGWKMKVVSGASKRPEVKEDYDDAGWDGVPADHLNATQLEPNQSAVFRARLNVSAADLSAATWQFNFDRIDDTGWIYVNGKSVGKTTDWSHAYSFEASKWLHPGTNVVAVVVHNDGGDGGLGAVTFGRALNGRDLVFEGLSLSGGEQRGWWNPKFSDRKWKTVAIGAGDAQSDLLTWYRMKFPTPPAKAGVWVPWHLHLEAAGNGFLYFNGHPIGRYWQAGPQHDFFLPECWFKASGDNSVVLNLRPADHGAGIQAARVEPYAEFAENR